MLSFFHSFLSTPQLSFIPKHIFAIIVAFSVCSRHDFNFSWIDLLTNILAILPGSYTMVTTVPVTYHTFVEISDESSRIKQIENTTQTLDHFFSFLLLPPFSKQSGNAFKALNTSDFSGMFNLLYTRKSINLSITSGLQWYKCTFNHCYSVSP